MSTHDDQRVMRRMALAFELCDLGERMSLERLRRKHPNADSVELADLLRAARGEIAPPALPGTVALPERFLERV